MRRTTAGAGIVIEKNVSVTMSDGVTLRLNVFRPRDVVVPVVMSVTPYGKDNTPDRIGMLAMRLVSYSATPRRPRADRVSFTHRFAEDTEITGSMALTVWMSTDQGTELDVLRPVRKHRKHPRPGGMLKTVDRRVTRLADHLLIRRVVRPACPSRTSAPTPALDQTYLDFQIVLGQVRPLHVTRPRAIHKF
jgi:hypothetical protein